MFIIAGLYHRQPLRSPEGKQTRPTSARLRESLFNICQDIVEGSDFLDLFAGSGAIGFEALSRGAKTATFVDSHRESIKCIQENAARLKVEPHCQILSGDVFKIIQELENRKKTFDIIFADPPYYKGLAQMTSHHFYSKQLIEWIDSHSLLRPGGVLFVEEDYQQQPHLDSLKKLHLKKSRKMGMAALQHYEKREIIET